MKNRLAKLLDFLPVPFWVYFFSILAGNIGLLPNQSPLYDAAIRHVLPVAIILMLIGTPLTDLVTMGPKALSAMAIATATIFIAQIVSYLLLLRYLPDEAWKSVGALMGTWIGGSANMVAVKEILQMPDDYLSPLVIVDAVMSYAWMALLLAVASRGRPSGEYRVTVASFEKSEPRAFAGAAVAGLALGFGVGEICVWLGKKLGGQFPLLPTNGWVLLLASTSALLLALTPLRRLKSWGAPKIGTLLLYLVLVTIGAKTTLGASFGAPIFLVYGVLAFAIHAILALALGKMFRVPFFLLSTASQANIGGAVSAPIVAEAYRPGTAHLGVLMAILGAVLGTYLGVAGGYLCRALGQWLQ